jgi:glycosyltransferase involved in cell wall biosynthesis
MKKVSVVIPAYDHDLYIGEAIESVLNSTYPNIELIVIDDGSKDRTKEKVMAFDKVKYYYQKNAGAFNAINTGISKATGEYVAILNDDDLYLPNHITSAIMNLEDFGNELFVGKARLIGYGSKLRDLKEHVSQSNLQIERLGYAESLFQINWSLSTSAFVFKRALYEKLDGFQNFSMCHDLDFLIRALAIEKLAVGTSHTPSWSYRCHGSNSGSKISIGKQNSEIIYCLGRSINSIIDELSPESLIQLIGYGISPDLILEMVKMKPWLNEADLGVDLAIHNWVDYCASNYSQ